MIYFIGFNGKFIQYQMAQIEEPVNEVFNTALKSLLTEITTTKVAQSVLVFILAFSLNFLLKELDNWLSEIVPIQFRLAVKQFLPFGQFFVFAIAILIAVNLLFDLSPNNLLAITGTVAVALGFAFKDYATSVIAGLVGLFEAPYRVGDRVQIGEYYGEVITYGLRSIRLQTLDDKIVTIPHDKIWTEAISSANAGELEAQVVADFYFTHDIDIPVVMRILYEVAYTSKYTQLKLPVKIFMDEQPCGTHFQLQCYAMDIRHESAFRTDLVKRAKQNFPEASVAYPVEKP